MSGKIFVVDWQESMLKDSELTAYAKFLGMYLRTFMNGKNEMAWPSLARIVGETSLSKNTVCRHLDILESAGWIARDRGNLGKNTRYMAVIPQNGSVRETLGDSEVVSERHRGSVREAQEVVSERHTNNQVNNQVITNTKDMSDKSDDCRVIFDYWLKVMEKNPRQVKYSTERKNKILQRLKDYSVDEIKRAIDGCKNSGHHMGKNDSKTKYNDIELICRNSSKLEGFRDMAAVVYNQRDPNSFLREMN